MHAIVEMMGHRKFGAKVEERELAGVKLLHCAVLAPQGNAVLGEQFVNPSSLYALTPCGEDVARKANADNWRLREAVPSLPAPVVEAQQKDPFLTDDDEEPGTPGELAVWLDDRIMDIEEYAGRIAALTKEQCALLQTLIDKAHSVADELRDNDDLPSRGAPFGDDTVGSGADDEDDDEQEEDGRE